MTSPCYHHRLLLPLLSSGFFYVFSSLLLILLILSFTWVPITTLTFIFFSLHKNYKRSIQFIERVSCCQCQWFAIIPAILLFLSICFVGSIPFSFVHILVVSFFFFCTECLFLEFIYYFTWKQYLNSKFDFFLNFIIWKERSGGGFVHRKIRIQILSQILRLGKKTLFYPVWHNFWLFDKSWKIF